MIRPPRLAMGCTIAVLSPSWGGPAAFPHIYEDGLRVLREDFGFRVKEYPTARMGADELHADPRARARDLNEAFADPEVDGIVCTIGGDDSVRILEYLDLGSILAHPKLIMGCSDATTILAYLNARGLVTYYGPSVMAGFSHVRRFPAALAEYAKALFEDKPYALEPFVEWTEGYPDWSEIGNRGKILERRTDDVGHRWINPGKPAAGSCWGGCLEVLGMMNGTFAWPDVDFWEGRILVLETSEDAPPPAEVGYFLRCLGVQGALSRIAGLLVARPKGYTKGRKAELEEWILKVALGEFGRRDLPIVANMDFGHTDPRHILPFGIELAIDPAGGTLSFTEPLFS